MQRWSTDAIRGKAKKPDDWDDEEDGEWEAPMIDNPEYKGHFGFKTGNANMECHEIVEDMFVWIFHFRLKNAAAMWHSPLASKGYKDQNTLTYLQYIIPCTL